MVLDTYFNYEMLNISNIYHIVPMIRLSDVVNIGNIFQVGFEYTFPPGIWRRHLLMYHQILPLNCWHRISEDLLLQFEFNDKEEPFPSQVFPQVKTDFQDRDIHPPVQARRLVSRWCAHHHKHQHRHHHHHHHPESWSKSSLCTEWYSRIRWGWFSISSTMYLVQ